MDFSAVMKPLREVTPHVLADPLVCGEFLRQDRSYTNWRPRGSGDWLLIFTLGGAGQVGTPSGPVRIAEGSAVLYRPGVAQDYFTDPSIGLWSLRWVHFVARPSWQPWLIWPEELPGAAWIKLSAEASKRVTDALGRMLFASRLEGRGTTELAMNALEEALIWAHRDLAGDDWLRLDERIRRAVTYLSSDPARPFSVAGLARHCGLSSSRLSHLFKEQVRMTPREFSEKLRLELAAQLLVHSGFTVREVAFKAGFEDPLYFSRRFARAFGRTPMESRTGGGRAAKR